MYLSSSATFAFLLKNLFLTNTSSVPLHGDMVLFREMLHQDLLNQSLWMCGLLLVACHPFVVFSTLSLPSRCSNGYYCSLRLENTLLTPFECMFNSALPTTRPRPLFPW